MAQLLLAARAGRQEGLEQIVVELSPLLWHVARAQGLDQASAQDAVQHTWLKLLTQLEQIRNPSALSAWLVTTAKREAWRLRAAQRTEPPADADALPEPVEPVPGPEEKVMLGERQREVWQAVHRLPQRCQELLRVVAFVQRPDYDRVAAALGMPRGSIGPTRGRCLAKLRTLLEAEPERGTA